MNRTARLVGPSVGMTAVAIVGAALAPRPDFAVTGGLAAWAGLTLLGELTFAGSALALMGGDARMFAATYRLPWIGDQLRQVDRADRGRHPIVVAWLTATTRVDLLAALTTLALAVVLALLVESTAGDRPVVDDNRSISWAGLDLRRTDVILGLVVLVIAVIAIVARLAAAKGFVVGPCLGAAAVAASLDVAQGNSIVGALVSWGVFMIVVTVAVWLAQQLRRERAPFRTGGGSDMSELFSARSDALTALIETMSAADPSALVAALADLDDHDWQQLARIVGPAATSWMRREHGNRPGATTDRIGTVVLLPGLMGSDLGHIGPDGTTRTLWFDLRELSNGGLDQLRLPTDGSPPPLEIVVGGLMQLCYLPLQMTLNRRWRTRLFRYDWRLGLEQTAEQLHAEVCDEAGPVHFVAHSSGGLACRAMIARHPETWTRLGGRLIMLGTPNAGSFAPALALLGKDARLRLLALFDPRLRARDISAVVGTFPGLVQLLPSRPATPDTAVDFLYDAKSWPNEPVAQHTLDGVAAMHTVVDAVVDPGRMAYVAGFGHRTVDAIVHGPSGLRFRRSRAGDGTVPHALGLLPDVATYWSAAEHGRLPADHVVMAAVDDLLANGTTDHLPSGPHPPVRVGDTGASSTDVEWLDDATLDGEVEQAARRVRSTTREIDAMAGVLPVFTTARTQVAIRLEVVWGGLAHVDADAVAVGHYQGVYPTSAELALDEALTGSNESRRGVLHAATARGALTGAIGDVFVVPWDRDGRSLNALVLGLGRVGTFQLPQHEVLVRNLVWTAERLLRAESIATVLIGAGAGNLSIDETLANLVGSLDVTVLEGELTGALKRITVIESDLGRARAIHETLQRIVAARDREFTPAIVEVADAVGEVDGGTVSTETLLQGLMHSVSADGIDDIERRLDRLCTTERMRAAMAEHLKALAALDGSDFVVSRRRDESASDAPTRLSVLTRDGALVASAVSGSATVPERDYGLSVELFTQLVDLANNQAAGDPVTAGRLLVRVVVPAEFRSLLDGQRDVVVEVDCTTATLPWEVLGSDPASPVDYPPLGLRTALARQLRTRRSPPPTITGRVVLGRALVIGDPGGPAGRLAGARREALEVAGVLREHGVQVDLLVGAGPGADTEAGWRWDAATLANVLHHLLHDDYQLVHYAGHGSFSTSDPRSKSGWEMADGFLDAGHLEMVERLPPLLVANACHSSRLSTGLPGLADEFIGRGVRNIVGTARAVGDESARRFSATFYARLLEGRPGPNLRPTLGRAVLDARRDLHRDDLPDWDVYQLYGDPLFQYARLPTQ